LIAPWRDLRDRRTPGWRRRALELGAPHLSDEPPQEDRIAYGGYLVGPVGHCTGCHTPPGAGGPDMSRACAGGRQLPGFGTPGAETVSRNTICRCRARDRG